MKSSSSTTTWTYLWAKSASGHRAALGGHRGIESIIDALGSQNVPRIRVGIGRPPPDVDEIPYVLGGFTAEEAPLIAEGLSMAQDAALDVLSHGLDWSMNRYN